MRVFAEPDLSRLPPPVIRTVDFTTDIKPILDQSCIRCHGPERPKSRFRLDNRESALKGGSQNTNDIVPGDSAHSLLIHYVAGLEPDMMMPPEGKGQPLTTNEVAILRAWIDQGAVWSEEEKSVSFSVAPAVGFTTVKGNEAKFREHQWMRDGWRAGVESFEMVDNSSPDVRLKIGGHALTDDYKADILAERRELGFVHFGFEQFRKYDSDLGGYYPLFTVPITNLNRDLFLDNGRINLDFGLVLPDWPKFVLGYEFQYRQGDESTLQWGGVTEGTNEIRNIYPGYKSINEQTHILKFDADYERNDWHAENNFRGEWSRSKTRQENINLVSLDPGGPVIRDSVQQGWNSFQGSDTVRVERQVKDWLYVSGGYLYSHLSGDADFNEDQFSPNGFPVQGSVQSLSLHSDSILLRRESNVGNINALFGPWQGGTLNIGVQGEWTEQNGSTDGTGDIFLVGGPPPPPPLQVNLHHLSDIERAAVDEMATLRYTRLPFTTLYAEGRLQQESIDQHENIAGQIVRDTDARSDAFDVRAGFDTSPWSWFKFGSYYRWKDKSTTYNDGYPSELVDPILGYPTFITARDLTTQEVESRISLRPLSWLKTTLSYRLVATDYHTETESASFTDQNNNLVVASPGGWVFAGNYDANIYSANFTLTPWHRLFFTTTLSYQDIRSTTTHDYRDAVVPYQGDTWSLLCHGRYALTAKTDVNLGYSFSTSDFSQNNIASGLPVGIEYNLHGVQIALVSRCTKNLTTKLQYGYYRYTEPTSGGASDYSAHSIFASLNLQFD